MWGPKVGEYLAGRVVALAGQLATPEREDNRAGAPGPWLSSEDGGPIPPERSTRPPEVLAGPPRTVARLETVAADWSGGFTSVDAARVVVDTRDGGAWATAVLPTGRPFTDQDFRTLLEYTPEPDYETLDYPTARLHRYRFVWETTADAPAGEYRLRIAGAWWDGTAARDYELVTAPFLVAPTTNLVASDLVAIDLGGGRWRVECRGWYPPNPDAYRLRPLDAPPKQPAPLPGGEALVTVRAPDGTDAPPAVAWDAETRRFAGTYRKTEPGEHAATLPAGALVDPWGNASGNALGPVEF